VEVDSTRAPEAADLARGAGFQAVEVRADLAGKHRVLLGRV
jgi:hypothetical protein